MPHIDPNTTAGVQPTIPGASGYTLAFSDEFASTPLDSKWRIFKDYGDFSGAFNWDLNAGGNSLLRVWPDAGANYPNWTMDSSGGNPFTAFFGVYECRVKLCRGRGIFPSFWMADAALSQPLKPEIDVFEAYGYDGGGWNNGAADGWRPLNAAWTIWYNGAGNTGQTSTLTLQTPNPCQPIIAQLDLSAAQHIYTCKIAPEGLTFWFDNTPWGCTTPLPWTQAEMDANPLNIILDLWWRQAGLPPPDPTNTPSGTSNAMEWDYVRYWRLPGAGGGSASATATFNCTVTMAPADSAVIQNVVHLEVAGNQIYNVELVSTATASTTLYGRFVVAASHESATLDWDTSSLTNGAVQARILAYDVPPGSVGTMTVAMATRTWTIANVTASDMPVMTYFDLDFR